MERRPDYEDERVRLWRFHPPAELEQDDPTVLRVAAEHEAPHESRVYRVRRGAENLAALMAIMTRSAPGHPALSLPIAALLSERFISEGLVKLLSKRHKETDGVSLLIVGAALGRRFLLRPLRRYTLSGYEEKVARFEQEWVTEGPLVRGPVVTPQDWEGYGANPDGPPLK